MYFITCSNGVMFSTLVSIKLRSLASARAHWGKLVPNPALAQAGPAARSPSQPRGRRQLRMLLAALGDAGKTPRSLPAVGHRLPGSDARHNPPPPHCFPFTSTKKICKRVGFLLSRNHFYLVFGLNPQKQHLNKQYTWSRRSH